MTSRPRLAPGEHDEFRWITRDELALFDERSEQDDGLLRRIVTSAYEQLPTPSLRAHHATIFVGGVPGLDDIRREWDPVMASQIAPHVTVAYPSEVPDADAMVERVRAATRAAAPFTIRLGEVVRAGNPDDGVFVVVDDSEGGWAQLRARIAGTAADRALPPHVTFVHPRTSRLGALAFAALRMRRWSETIAVSAVGVTAYDGSEWRTVATFAL